MKTDQFAIKYQSLVFWVIAAGALAGSIAILLPFIPAILWAIVLSVLMHPLYARFCNRFKGSRVAGGERASTSASLATVASTVLIVMIPLLLIGVGLFAQIGGLSTSLAGETGKPSFESFLNSLDRGIQPF